MCVVSAVVVILEPLIGAETYVNGKQITEAVILKQGAVPETDSMFSEDVNVSGLVSTWLQCLTQF